MSVVRILTLDEKFFAHFGCEKDEYGEVDYIEGIDEAITLAQEHVDEYGVPVCDYQIYKNITSKTNNKSR